MVLSWPPAAMPWYNDNRSLNSVIPAQAGIRSSPLVNSNCGLAWGPASAEMTGGESGAFKHCHGRAGGHHGKHPPMRRWNCAMFRRLP